MSAASASRCCCRRIALLSTDSSQLEKRRATKWAMMVLVLAWTEKTCGCVWGVDGGGGQALGKGVGQE